MLNRHLLAAAAVAIATAPAMSAAPAFAQATPAPFNKQRVTYTHDGLTLVGFVFKPNGPGPFPAVLWNHGSEPDPAGGPQFDSVAAQFVPAGYAVFAPVRRGHAGSQGKYIQDTIRATVAARGMPTAEKLMVHLHETEQLGDQLAFLEYARKQTFVDTSRLVVAGCSYGGIQTLLAAERGASVGLKAAMPISPAALSWEGHTVLQDRMKQAARSIDIPVLLIQPPKDASLEPVRQLGEAARAAGRPRFTAKVYPPTMPDAEQAHCFGGAKGMHNWAPEAVDFFDGVLKRR